MKLLSIALCLILASLTRAQHIFSIDGQKYVQPDYRSELAKSKWDFQSSKHPPISLQEAYAEGLAVIKKLRPNESWSLEFTQMMTSKEGQAHITLAFVRDEHFTEEQKQDGARPALIALTVLMDGKVLAPIPTK
jgi:hypothetical protein